MQPKHYMGRDNEFSTTGIDHRGEAISPWDVTRHVLEKVPAVFASRGQPTWSRGNRRSSMGWSGYGYSASQDCLRLWGPNGACYYSDMAHVEGCTAETLFPRTFAAQTFAMVKVVEEVNSIL